MSENSAYQGPANFFISGADLTTNGMANEDFDKTEAILKQRGYTVVNPRGLNPEMRIALMAMCAKVVTLEGWENDSQSGDEVQIARIMKKEVVFAHAFERWMLRNAS